jgi:transcriptional regulator with XRE-family HTH domain
MIDRIILVLKTQNLTSSQFADEIGVQRSSISHILSGRNNPSLEFVTKILKRFPDINSEWILFGKGSMYRHSEMINKDEKRVLPQQADLFSFDQPYVEINEILPTKVNVEEKYAIQEEEKIQEIPAKVPVIEVIKPEKQENILNENILQIEKKEEIFLEEKKIEKEIHENVIPKKEIERILIFYSDKSFREYSPE